MNKIVCKIFGHSFTIFQQQQNNTFQTSTKTCGRCGLVHTTIKTKLIKFKGNK